MRIRQHQFWRETHKNIFSTALMLSVSGIFVASWSRAQPSAPPSSLTTTATASSSAPKEKTEQVIALTSDIVATRALKTSRALKVDEAKIRIAAAQLNKAWSAYWPKLDLTARYTRLSPITQPSFGGDGSLVGTTQAPGPLTAGSPLFALPAFSFPVILDNYVLQGTVSIPLSDYVFRVTQNYKSALSNEQAAKLNAKTTEFQVAYDARNTYYTWVRAREQLAVAKAAVDQAKAHLKDMENQLVLKSATRADTLRVEAQVAAAELAVARTQNLVEISDANLRTFMHASEYESFSQGESMLDEVPKIAIDARELKAKALAKRPELRALDAQIESVEKRIDVATASYYPRLDAVGNLTYANPNPRIVPQVSVFRPTWDISLQLTWSPNEILNGNSARAEAMGNLANLKASREQLVDALSLEVINAYTKAREAEATLVSAQVQRRAAEEAYRVRREQFQAGTVTSSMLIDAETDVTRARIDEVNARIDVRVAKLLIRKASGEL